MPCPFLSSLTSTWGSSGPPERTPGTSGGTTLRAHPGTQSPGSGEPGRDWGTALAAAGPGTTPCAWGETTPAWLAWTLPPATMGWSTLSRTCWTRRECFGKFWLSNLRILFRSLLAMISFGFFLGLTLSGEILPEIRAKLELFRDQKTYNWIWIWHITATIVKKICSMYVTSKEENEIPGLNFRLQQPQRLLRKTRTVPSVARNLGRKKERRSD